MRDFGGAKGLHHAQNKRNRREALARFSGARWVDTRTCDSQIYPSRLLFSCKCLCVYARVCVRVSLPRGRSGVCTKPDPTTAIELGSRRTMQSEIREAPNTHSKLVGGDDFKRVPDDARGERRGFYGAQDDSAAWREAGRWRGSYHASAKMAEKGTASKSPRQYCAGSRAHCR